MRQQEQRPGGSPSILGLPASDVPLSFPVGVQGGVHGGYSLGLFHCHQGDLPYVLHHRDTNQVFC